MWWGVGGVVVCWGGEGVGAGGGDGGGWVDGGWGCGGGIRWGGGCEVAGWGWVGMGGVVLGVPLVLFLVPLTHACIFVY